MNVHSGSIVVLFVLVIVALVFAMKDNNQDDENQRVGTLQIGEGGKYKTYVKTLKGTFAIRNAGEDSIGPILKGLPAGKFLVVSSHLKANAAAGAAMNINVESATATDAAHNEAGGNEMIVAVNGNVANGFTTFGGEFSPAANHDTLCLTSSTGDVFTNEVTYTLTVTILFNPGQDPI